LAASPTQRTLSFLRRTGWTVGVVEKWNPNVGDFGIRQDLWGLDILAVRMDKGFLGVQCCSAGDSSKRVRKLLAMPTTRTLLLAGMRIEVWGWKRNSLGKWDVNRRKITLGDLHNGQAEDR
jgi:hypothetical protein